MGIGLSCCDDIEAIKAVFTHPDIWETIAEDTVNTDAFTIKEDELYVSVSVDKTIIGFYSLASRNSIEIDIHAQILPKYRKEYALPSGYAILQWIYMQFPQCLKLTAQIPFKYPNVKAFALSIGFTIEGINRQSYRKHGEVFDQWHLGITREEIRQKYELG